MVPYKVQNIFVCNTSTYFLLSVGIIYYFTLHFLQHFAAVPELSARTFNPLALEMDV